MALLEYSIPPSPNPTWGNPEHTQINLMVHFPHLGEGPVPYTTSESDPGWEHSEEIFARASGGEFGPVGEYVSPAPPVPDVISDRQFITALKHRGIVTHSEAMAFVARGVIPSALQSLINTFPTLEDREAAELLIAGATEFHRTHPLSQALAAGLGWGEGDLDQFFVEAAGT